MAVTPGTSSTQSGVQVTFGTAVPAGTTIQMADSGGKVVATFVTAKATASLVFSSAAITAGEEYTVYTGGTAQRHGGPGRGIPWTAAQQQGTVTAGRVHGGTGPRRPLRRTAAARHTLGRRPGSAAAVPSVRSRTG